jgi:hypothetical protein
VIDKSKQALPVFTMIAGLIGANVVLQLWLLGSSLEAVLAGKSDVTTAATVASVVLLAVNVGLLAYVFRVDRRVRS